MRWGWWAFVPKSGGESAEDLLRELADEIRLSWEDDVKPFGERGTHADGAKRVEPRIVKSRATSGTRSLEGVNGAAVLRFDMRRGGRDLLERFGVGISTEVPVGEVVGSVDATTERLRATLRVELPWSSSKPRAAGRRGDFLTD